LLTTRPDATLMNTSNGQAACMLELQVGEWEGSLWFFLPVPVRDT
jgi:hypothetical protein